MRKQKYLNSTRNFENYLKYKNLKKNYLITGHTIIKLNFKKKNLKKKFIYLLSADKLNKLRKYLNKNKKIRLI